MNINYLSRKEKIVLTTISLIHEAGVSNVSMKDIAKREGVTDASLYKHFKNKEELLNAVMEYYEKYDSLIYSTLQNNEVGPIENLKRYFAIYSEYYSNYKEITSLINAYDVLAHDQSFLDRKIYVINQKSEFIKKLIEKGQESGEITKTIEAENMAHILLGSFDRLIAMWRINKYSFSLSHKTKEIIDNLFKVFGTNQVTVNN